MHKKIGVLILLLIILGSESALTLKEKPKVTDSIRLNQIGFYLNGPKVAVILTNEATEFYISDIDQKKTFFKGKLGVPVKSLFSEKIYKAADFSAFKTPGTYILIVPGVGMSHKFEITENVHYELSKAVIKNYYYQRMSIPLEEKYAGKWHRAAGHPDNQVLIHASAVSENKPEGHVVSAPRGWYDAGDYNKYIVNSGITMGTMFSAYEDFQDYFKKLNLNIPESNNEVPDLLDELLWNLRWMLAMQDPDDGGVYHKLTNARFDAMVMPDKATAPRYMVQKSTTAALDFAAVCAQASRVFSEFDAQLPGLSDSCLSAAKKAWLWAIKNPNVPYNQNQMNKTFDPDIVTGAYGDSNFSDEFVWAACELLITTQDDGYASYISRSADWSTQLPSWNGVKLLGYYSLLRFEKNPSLRIGKLVEPIKEAIKKFGNELADGTDKNPFQTVMGKTAKDYIWGSSAVAANQGVALIQVYKLTGDAKFLNLAIANIDYLLGRNATGYSFVTGYGSKTPMHPHHRPSEADGVPEPIPGMLSGGPNPSMQDKCNYPSTVADEAFVDDVCSYASNEIAINWNAPLVYLSSALEVLADKKD